MQKWEYLVIFIEDSKIAQDMPELDVYIDVDKYTQALNTYGEAGWEMVSFAASPNGAHASFKRPRVEEDRTPYIPMPQSTGFDPNLPHAGIDAETEPDADDKWGGN